MQLQKIGPLMADIIGVASTIGQYRRPLVRDLERYLALQVSYALLLDQIANNQDSRYLVRNILYKHLMSIGSNKIVDSQVICDETNNPHGKPLGVYFDVSLTNGIEMKMNCPGYFTKSSWISDWTAWRDKLGTKPSLCPARKKPVDIMEITRGMIESRG